MRALAIACLLGTLTGCTTWRTVGEYDTHLEGEDPVVRTDALVASMSVSWDGSLTVHVDTEHMCRFETPPRLRHVVVQRHVITGLGYAGMFVGLGLGLFARLAPMNPLALPAALAGASLQLVPVLTIASSGRRQREIIDDQPDSDGEAITSCMLAGRDLGTLTVTTPWGAVYTAEPDIIGDADVTIDWRAAPRDDAKLVGRYRVHLSGGDKTFGWTPEGADRQAIVDAAHAAHAAHAARAQRDEPQSQPSSDLEI